MKATKAEKFEAIMNFLVEYGSNDDFSDYDLTTGDIYDFLSEEKAKADKENDLEVTYEIKKQKTVYIPSTKLGMDVVLQDYIESERIGKPYCTRGLVNTIIKYLVNNDYIEDDYDSLGIVNFHLRGVD